MEEPLIEIILSTEPKDSTLITFDGKVLEFFSSTSRDSGRYHAAHIASIQLAEDKQGRNLLSVQSKYVGQILLGGIIIRPEVLAETQSLVAAVQKAMVLYS